MGFRETEFWENRTSRNWDFVKIGFRKIEFWGKWDLGKTEF